MADAPGNDMGRDDDRMAVIGLDTYATQSASVTVGFDDDAPKALIADSGLCIGGFNALFDLLSGDFKQIVAINSGLYVDLTLF